MLPPEFVTPDLRRLFAVAKAYLQGLATIQELNGAVLQARDSAQLAGCAPIVLATLDDWRTMTSRCWNEFGTERMPLSNERFKDWIRDQLVGVAG